MLKRTPLYPIHQGLGARLIDFGGWEMPVQYTSILAEHQAVRTAAGLFDISHMGEVRVVGANAREFLNRVLTNDVRRLGAGNAHYTLACNERGGVIDDLYAYCLADREFLLVINASRIEADLAWFRAQWARFPGKKDVELVDVSPFLSALAVQGPNVAVFIDACIPGPASGGTSAARPTDLKKNQIAAFRLDGTVVWVARTGYTGEDGFELITPNALAETLWRRLMDAGGPHGLKPVGLGARDTLRTEVCYPLYGHELDEDTSPLEAGLGVFVALDKPDFVGRAALAEQKVSGLKQRCVAFKMVGKSAPPRPGYPVWSTAATPQRLGKVVSGTLSPTLGIGIGMAYVPPDSARPGTPLGIEIRGQTALAEVVAKPIYRRPATH